MPDTAGTLVDSNVLLDVATADPIWSSWSEAQLAAAIRRGPVFVNPLIYAEISVGFDRIEDLDDALPAHVFIRAELPYEAGFLAGHAFSTYRRRGGAPDGHRCRTSTSVLMPRSPDCSCSPGMPLAIELTIRQ